MKIKGIFEKLLPPELLNVNELVRLKVLLAKVLELCKQYDNPKILDVGCGDSRMIMALQHIGYNIVGIDSSEEMLDAGKELCGRNDMDCETWLQDATKIEFPKNSFDIIVCSEVLEHIKKDISFRKIIRQMKRVCKDDGYIIITTPYMNRVDGTENYPHYRSFGSLSFNKYFTKVELFDIPTKVKLWIGLVVKNENRKHNRN